MAISRILGGDNLSYSVRKKYIGVRFFVTGASSNLHKGKEIVLSLSVVRERLGHSVVAVDYEEYANRQGEEEEEEKYEGEGDYVDDDEEDAKRVIKLSRIKKSMKRGGNRHMVKMLITH
ncbi:unnamed protein product [Cochlearia groenlandica]